MTYAVMDGPNLISRSQFYISDGFTTRSIFLNPFCGIFVIDKKKNVDRMVSTVQATKFRPRWNHHLKGPTVIEMYEYPKGREMIMFIGMDRWSSLWSSLSSSPLLAPLSFLNPPLALKICVWKIYGTETVDGWKKFTNSLMIPEIVIISSKFISFIIKLRTRKCGLSLKEGFHLLNLLIIWNLVLF